MGVQERLSQPGPTFGTVGRVAALTSRTSRTSQAVSSESSLSCAVPSTRSVLNNPLHGVGRGVARASHAQATPPHEAPPPHLTLAWPIAPPLHIGPTPQPGPAPSRSHSPLVDHFELDALGLQGPAEAAVAAVDAELELLLELYAGRPDRGRVRQGAPTSPCLRSAPSQGSSPGESVFLTTLVLSFCASSCAGRGGVHQRQAPAQGPPARPALLGAPRTTLGYGKSKRTKTSRSPGNSPVGGGPVSAERRRRAPPYPPRLLTWGRGQVGALHDEEQHLIAAEVREDPAAGGQGEQALSPPPQGHPVLYLFILVFLRQGLAVWFRLALSSLCGPGEPLT